MFWVTMAIFHFHYVHFLSIIYREVDYMNINIDTIVKDDNSHLRDKSAPVALPLSKEDRAILTDLLTYVKESTDPDLAEEKNLRPAVGIAAIQVGIAKQMLAVVVDDEDKNGNLVHYEYALANAHIVSQSVQNAYLKMGEGCLSVEGEHPGYVVRSARIKVKAYDMLQDKEITLRASGYLAIVLQHEIDHFSGTLFYDRINKKDPFAKVENAIVIE